MHFELKLSFLNNFLNRYYIVVIYRIFAKIFCAISKSLFLAASMTHCEAGANVDNPATTENLSRVSARILTSEDCAQMERSASEGPGRILGKGHL